MYNNGEVRSGERVKEYKMEYYYENRENNKEILRELERKRMKKYRENKKNILRENNKEDDLGENEV
jgi:spermidine/putrescine-binding protein